MVTSNITIHESIDSDDLYLEEPNPQKDRYYVVGEWRQHGIARSYDQGNR